jgi:hypothetical protein
MPLTQAAKQNDQIGRIIAFWVIVYLGIFLLITEVSQIFGITFKVM